MNGCHRSYIYESLHVGFVCLDLNLRANLQHISLTSLFKPNGRTKFSVHFYLYCHGSQLEVYYSLLPAPDDKDQEKVR